MGTKGNKTDDTRLLLDKFLMLKKECKTIWKNPVQ